MYSFKGADAMKNAIRTCLKNILFVAVLAVAVSGMSAMGGSGGGMLTITAVYVSGANGLNPSDPGWSSAAEVSIPINRFIDFVEGGGGMMDCNMMGDMLNRTLRVKALHNGSTMYIRYTLSDATQDASVGDTDLFGDAIALEIPYARTTTPPICMGSQADPVNIIMWRGDLAAPQNIVAGGIGTVQVSPDSASQNLTRYQANSKGVWTVIVARPMAAASSNQVAITRGLSYRIAYANWNGSNTERNGRKGFSSWHTLAVQ